MEYKMRNIRFFSGEASKASTVACFAIYLPYFTFLSSYLLCVN